MKALFILLLVGLLGVYASQQAEHEVSSTDANNELIESLQKQIETIASEETAVPKNIQKLVGMIDEIIARIQREGAAAKQDSDNQKKAAIKRITTLQASAATLKGQVADGQRKSKSFKDRISALQLTIQNINFLYKKINGEKKKTEDRLGVARYSFNNRQFESELAIKETKELIALFASVASQLQKVTLLEEDSQELSTAKSALDAHASEASNSQVKNFLQLAQVAVEVAEAAPKKDTSELISVLDKLRAELEAHLASLQKNKAAIRKEFDDLNKALSAQISALDRQLALKKRENSTATTEVTTLRSHIASFEKNAKDIADRLVALNKEVGVTNANSLAAAKRFQGEDAERARQIKLLRKLREMLGSKALSTELSEVKVDSSKLAENDVAFTGTCDSADNWAKNRRFEYWDRLGGCVNCAATCPKLYGVRSVKVNNCGTGGLNLKYDCTPPPATPKFAASARTFERNGDCSRGGVWGVGTSASLQELARIGGKRGGVATCAKGEYLAGWGIKRCDQGQSLSVFMKCVRFSGYKSVSPAEIVEGECDDQPNWAWGFNANFDGFGRMPKAECTPGSFVNGVGFRHCPNNSMRMVLSCISYDF